MRLKQVNCNGFATKQITSELTKLNSFSTHILYPKQGEWLCDDKQNYSFNMTYWYATSPFSLQDTLQRPHRPVAVPSLQIHALSKMCMERK
jgi:hypothetical protein